MHKLIICYFFFLIFFSSLFVSGVIDSQDGFQYLAVARNIYYQHEPTGPPYEFTGGVWVGKNIHFNTQIGKNGKPYSGTGLGYSLAMLPAVFLADIVYKIYHITPPVHFPLESDWFILFAASFTNIVYTALLGVILFLYFLKIQLSIKQAIFLSFVSIFTTNLFALSKHIYAHMIFTSFLFLSFYLLKKYTEKKKKIFLIFSVIAFGIVSTLYNQTFLLSVIPLIVYYLLLTKPLLNMRCGKLILRDCLIALITLLPFFLVYFWFENLRAVSGIGYANPTYFVNYAQYVATPSQIPLVFEGIYEQLLSPGRSIFLYSPILLLILIFWYKIKKIIRPELIIFLILCFSYILLYAKQLQFENGYNKLISYWHGELSWGPRYLLPLIPFGMLIVGHVYKQLGNKAKIFVVAPLLAAGLFVEILGITIPYQTKLHNLQTDVVISGYHYTSFDYMNIIPQLSPIFPFTRQLKNLTRSFPQTLEHGSYNVRFYDGIDFPFSVGGERWRAIDNQGYISFDNNLKDPIKKISLTLINHPLAESTSSAKINIFINQKRVNSEFASLVLGKRSDIDILIPNFLLKEKDNQLLIDTNFEDQSIVKAHKQLIALLGLYINGKPTNLESLDFPYISDLGPAMNQSKYQNYGGVLNNPWQSWMIHTQIFERTPDLWWIKFLYYWDVPKEFFLILFLINVFMAIYFGIKLFACFNQIKNIKKL